jgi:hypothetical protein
MTPKSKRQMMREGMSRPGRKRTAADREKLGKDMISGRKGPPPLEKILLLLEPEELRFLDVLVAELKPARRRTSRNEIIRLGITSLKDKSTEEIQALLRNLG